MLRILSHCTFTVSCLLLANVALAADLFPVHDPNLVGNGFVLHDGFNLNRDPNTGLDWLDITLSVNRSYNEVAGELGPGDDYPGFMIGTQAQMETLFANAGLPPSGHKHPFTPAMERFMSLFGSEGHQADGQITTGQYDNQDGNPDLVGAAFVSTVPTGPADDPILVLLNPTPMRRGDPTMPNPSGGIFLVRPTPDAGDVDFSGAIDVVDIDMLTAAIRSMSTDLTFDVDGSMAVNAADVSHLVEDILGTTFGDADLNGTVTASGDGAILLANLGGAQGNKGWADADFDGDQNVTASADGSVLLTNLSTDAAAVPEPDGLLLAVAGLLLLGFLARLNLVQCRPWS